MLAPAPLRCPISLDAPPLCPQITPCGHVFAFPAIMAHLAAHNDGASVRRAAPCPLCYAPVVARELRLVRVHQASAPQVCALACLRLTARVIYLSRRGVAEQCSISGALHTRRWGMC